MLPGSQGAGLLKHPTPWEPLEGTFSFIFNSVRLANLNNIIDFLCSWSNPSQDEHSCLAPLRGGVSSLEIYIHTHLCCQLILIDFALSVQMNSFVILSQHAPKLVFLAVIFKSLLTFKLLSSKRSSSIKFMKYPCTSSHS